jgi:hypothetical protein
MSMPKDIMNSDDNESDKSKKCSIKACYEEVDGTSKITKFIDPRNKSREEIKDLEQAFNELTGIENFDLAAQIYGLCVMASTTSDNEERNTNIAMQALAESQANDVVEARLSSQAHALYTQGMKRLSHGQQSQRIDQADFHFKWATRFLRLHNETIEALNRYRRKGEQKVVVQHVNVNDGGNAIVGSQMIAGGRGET